jgi:hypothetical protein
MNEDPFHVHINHAIASIHKLFSRFKRFNLKSEVKRTLRRSVRRCKDITLDPKETLYVNVSWLHLVQHGVR